MSQSRSSRRSDETPVIEALEGRRLLSADLTGLFSGTLPGTLQSADKNHAVVRLLNDGDAVASGTVNVDLLASGPDGSDTFLAASVKNVNLKPGKATPVKFQFAEPAGLADGSYSLMAQINPGTTPDANPANDIVIAPAPITARQPFVELAVQKVGGPAQPFVINGDTVRSQPASAKIINDGTAMARGGDTVDFYLSSDSKLDGNDILVGSMNDGVVTLKPGKSVTVRTQIQPSTNTPSGNYFLLAEVTPGGGVVQKTSADEVGIAPRQVQVVVINPVTLPTGGTVGQTDKNPSPVDCAPVTDDSGSTTDDSSTPTDDSQPVCNPPDNCPAPSDDNCDQPTDDGSDSSDDSQPTDDSDQPTDDSSSDSAPQSDGSQDDSNAGQDDSGQQSDSSDTSDTSTDDSGNDGSDDSTDSSADDSGDSSTDDSGDSSSDDSSDSSADDSGDTSSDDSGDSSSDDSSTDDSGDDQSEGDDIFRRSSTMSHDSNNVFHKPASTQKHAAGYNTQRHLISGGHK